MNRLIPALLLAMLLTTGACRTTPPSDERSDVPNEDSLARLERQITEEIGTPDATSAAQCRTIALGTKPCGGPWKYLAYSTAVSDEARLKQLVSEYNALEDRINKATGRASDCMMVTDPGPALQNGVCTLATQP